MVYQPGATRRKNSAWRGKRRELLYKAQAGLCYWCGKKLFLYPKKKVFSVDSSKMSYTCSNSKHPQMEIEHIMPVTIGGSNHISNTVGACKSCNLARARWFEKSRYKFIIIGSTLSYHQEKKNDKM